MSWPRGSSSERGVIEDSAGKRTNKIEFCVTPRCVWAVHIIRHGFLLVNAKALSVSRTLWCIIYVCVLSPLSHRILPDSAGPWMAHGGRVSSSSRPPLLAAAHHRVSDKAWLCRRHQRFAPHQVRCLNAETSSQQGHVNESALARLFMRGLRLFSGRWSLPMELLYGTRGSLCIYACVLSPLSHRNPAWAILPLPPRHSRDSRHDGTRPSAIADGARRSSLRALGFLHEHRLGTFASESVLRALGSMDGRGVRQDRDGRTSHHATGTSEQNDMPGAPPSFRLRSVSTRRM